MTLSIRTEPMTAFNSIHGLHSIPDPSEYESSGSSNISSLSYTAPEADRSQRMFCGRCPASFSRATDLRRHLTSVHNNQQPQFKCLVDGCPRRRGFQRKDKLIEHLRSHHHHQALGRVAKRCQSLPQLNDGKYVDFTMQNQGERPRSSTSFTHDWSPSPEAAASTNEPGSLGNDDRTGLRNIARNDKSDVGMLAELQFGVQDSCATESRDKLSNQSSPNPSINTSLRYACPFYKRGCGFYQFPPCIGLRWASVHRLKEHLYRRHRQSIRCKNCLRPFENKKKFLEHLQLQSNCSLEHEAVVPGFTEAQESQLRRRQRVSKEKTEEDKWNDIYIILFPHDDRTKIPSPCKCTSWSCGLTLPHPYEIRYGGLPYEDYDDKPASCYAQTQFLGWELLDQYDKFLGQKLPELVQTKIRSKILLCNNNLDIDFVNVLVDVINEGHGELSREFMGIISRESPTKFASEESEDVLSAGGWSEWPFVEEDLLKPISESPYEDISQWREVY